MEVPMDTALPSPLPPVVCGSPSSPAEAGHTAPLGAAEETLATLLTRLFCRPGSPFAGQDLVAKVRIAWELASGRWVLVTGPGNRLWGWASYVLVDAPTLELFRTGAVADYVAEGIPLDLASGDHLYVTTALAAPWAPHGVYDMLWKKLRDAAPPRVRSVSGHLVVQRDGTMRWHQRWLEPGAQGRKQLQDWDPGDPDAPVGPSH